MGNPLANIQKAVKDFAQFPSNSELDNKRNRFLFGFFVAFIFTHFPLLIADLIVEKHQFVPSHIIRLIAVAICFGFLKRNKPHASLYILITVIYFTVLYNVFSMPNYSLDSLILFPLGAGIFIVSRNYTLTFVYFIFSCVLFILGQYFQFTYQEPDFDVGYIYTIIAVFGFFYASLAFYLFEFKYFEKEIRIKNEELSSAVTKLTAQNSKLEETNQLITQIMAVIAHDLRNPFNNMIGYSTLLNKNFDGYEDEKKKHFIVQILTASEQGHAVLENLLNWARSHSGTLTATKIDTDIVGLVGRIVDGQDSQSKLKNVFIFVESPQYLVWRTDAVILSTIIRNLLQNSIKFSPQNSTVTVIIGMAKDELTIRVRNSGMPIPEEQQKVIMAKTIPLSTAGTIGEKGTGLGLLICQDFVGHLDGNISLHSDEEYTEFAVHLPR